MKRIEQVDKRFETMQHNMNKRFEQVDKRFEDLQHYMDKRFNQLTWMMGIGFTGLVTLITVFNFLS